MAGIYVHIPFCKQACHYCNFHFATSLRYKNEFTHALLKEIEIVADNNSRVETIYFGGGTPSLLSAAELNQILAALFIKFAVAPDAEITLECNPDDITEDLLRVWKKAGINRLSIGVQSFYDEDLSWMNRAHHAKQALDSILLAKKYFSNFTIDLIYGVPNLSDERWQENVEQAISLGVPHLSCYALTVEPNTPLQKHIREKTASNVNDEQQARQFLLLTEWLQEADYLQYEVSNFSLAGFQSKHNSSYWQGKPYLGFGPSAHSYDGANKRWWNIANNQQYIASIAAGKLPITEEWLTDTQQKNERIMIGLRTAVGLPLAYFTEAEKKILLEKAIKYFDEKCMEIKNNQLILTTAGMLRADGIAADLFFES